VTKNSLVPISSNPSLRKSPKPQPVYCGRLTEAEGGPVTSPTSQWEKRVGNRERGRWADSQWEKRDEQTDLQSIQIGLEGKLGELAD
jgi:hypothetical protein